MVRCNMSKIEDIACSKFELLPKVDAAFDLR